MMTHFDLNVWKESINLVKGIYSLYVERIANSRI